MSIMDQVWLWLAATVVCVGLVASVLERKLAQMDRRLSRIERRLDAVISQLGIPLFQGELDKVAALVQQGKKIQAIRTYRQLTGAGLKEARDAVETMAGSRVDV